MKSLKEAKQQEHNFIKQRKESEMKMLTGKYQGKPIEISFEFSSAQRKLEKTRRSHWKPSSDSMCTEDSQFEDHLCRSYRGSKYFQDNYPKIIFYFSGYRGEKHWLTLEMIYNSTMTIQQAKEFNSWMRKIEFRILRTWRTVDWKNIKGLKPNR